MSATGTSIEEWDQLDGSDSSSDTEQWSLLDTPPVVITNERLELPALVTREASSDSIDSGTNDDDDQDLQLALALSLQRKEESNHRCAKLLEAAASSSSNTITCTKTASTGAVFSAQWQVNLPAVEDEPMVLGVWGERAFLAPECDGDCVHRKVILAQGGSSTDSGLDYSIQLSHLRAPSEEGHYSELWRLRNVFGHLIGPILEIKLNVTAATPFETHRRKRFRREVTPGGELPRYEAEIIDHGPLNIQLQSGIPTNTTYQYTWKLRNSGQIEWTPPFALERVDLDPNAPESSSAGTRFAITSEYRRLVVGPIARNAIVHVTLSGLDTGESTGLREQVWRLTSISKGHILADALPLR
jgi:hypothetical protein